MLIIALLLLPLLTLLLPTPGLAHSGGLWVGPNEVRFAWTLDPWTLLPMGLLWWLYGRGLARQPRFRDRRAVCFAAGMILMVLALVWPLDAMGETLFSAHMAQHMVLTVFAPPLLLLGRPAGPVLAALPLRLRRGAAVAAQRARRGLAPLLRPGPASLIHAAAVWGWHAPAAFNAALLDDWVHRAEHASFFLTGLLFWAMVLRALAPAATRERERLHPPAAAGAVLFTLMHSGLLGCLIAFAPVPLYAYGIKPIAWGLTPLEDQQLAGLVMWVPAGFAYIGAGVLLLGVWLKRMTPQPPQTLTRPSHISTVSPAAAIDFIDTPNR